MLVLVVPAPLPVPLHHRHDLPRVRVVVFHRLVDHAARVHCHGRWHHLWWHLRIRHHHTTAIAWTRVAHERVTTGPSIVRNVATLLFLNHVHLRVTLGQDASFYPLPVLINFRVVPGLVQTYSLHPDGMADCDVRFLYNQFTLNPFLRILDS